LKRDRRVLPASFFLAGLCALGLLIPSRPAFAGYECVARGIQGSDDQTAIHQKITVTIDAQYSKATTRLERLLNFGYSREMGRRFFLIHSYGPDRGHLKPNYLSMSYTAPLKTTIKPLFAFLVLNTGEYVQSLVIDAQGRRWLGSLEAGLFNFPDRVVVSFTSKETVFLDAFEKAKTMAIELKYADGETLVRETFDISRPNDAIERTLDAASEMEKSNECKFIDPGVEL